MMPNAPGHSELHLTRRVHSEPREIAVVSTIIDELRTTIATEDLNLDMLAIAFTEAVNNAIHHGNKCNPDKMVEVELTVDPSHLKLTVSDEGKGFDPTTLEDPTKPENLLKESGRGVFILRELMDHVDYRFSKHGTQLTIVKNRIIEP